MKRQALALFILTLLFSFCSEAAAFDIDSLFSIGGTNYGDNSGQGWSIDSVSGYGLPSGTIFGIITGILNWLLAIIGIIAIIGFLIAGSTYILSSGDETMAKKAKNAMTNSIIGIVVALAGLVVIQAAVSLLNGSIF